MNQNCLTTTDNFDNLDPPDRYFSPFYSNDHFDKMNMDTEKPIYSFCFRKIDFSENKSRTTKTDIILFKKFSNDNREEYPFSFSASSPSTTTIEKMMIFLKKTFYFFVSMLSLLHKHRHNFSHSYSYPLASRSSYYSSFLSLNSSSTSSSSKSFSTLLLLLLLTIINHLIFYVGGTSSVSNDGDFHKQQFLLSSDDDNHDGNRFLLTPSMFSSSVLPPSSSVSLLSLLPQEKNENYHYQQEKHDFGSRRSHHQLRDELAHQHPLLSIVNFSSSDPIHSNTNELFPSMSSSLLTELNHHHHPIAPMNVVFGPINPQDDDESSFSFISSSSSLNHHQIMPKVVLSSLTGQTSTIAPTVLLINKDVDKQKIDHVNKNENGDDDVNHDVNELKNSNRNPRRNSKLGQDFPPLQVAANGASTSKELPARTNSKDLSRSNQHAGGSSMDDLLGGLAQLLGGNLKVPSNNNGGSFPISSEQTKLAQLLLSQITGSNQNNLGLNQRIPSHLNHLIPRGPNGTPMLPAFLTNGLPPKLLPPRLPHNPNGPNFSMGPSSPNSNYPPFQIPFIPLLSAGTGSRPAAIPLNNQNISPPKPPTPSINSLAQMHGLSKAEIDVLLHQFISGNSGTAPAGINKTNPMISNIISKLNNNAPLGDKLDHSSNNKIDTFLPFNLNDTNRLIIHSLISPSSTASSQEPPQIITMNEGPSVFEMVVKHKIGPSVSTTESMNVRPTSTLVQSISSFSSATLIQPSMQSPDITEIRNHHLHHSQILKVTSNPQNTKLTDVVYGKRITTETTLLKSSTTEIMPSFMTPTSTSISVGKTFLQPGNIQTSSSEMPILPPSTLTSISSSTVSFGKPVVMQMPIENVKPQIGQFDPTRTIDTTTKFPGSSKVGFIESQNVKPIQNTKKPNQIVGTGNFSSLSNTNSSTWKKSQAKPYVRRPSFRPRPNIPIVRIDTCIVGDDSTCDMTLNEKCITELGLSSCQCRPGFARTIPRTNCVPVISLALSFRVDKMAGNKVQFTRPLLNPNSEEYQYLEYESIHAMNSLFAQTKTMNMDLMAVKINRFYAVGGRTVVNATVSLRNNDTSVNSQRIKRALQQELTQVIIESQNNLGESQLSVDSSTNAVTRIDDLNECSSPEHNDCSKNARCINEFGGFRCECEPGYEDKFYDDYWQSGRVCSTCSPQYCSNRGECLIVKGERVCRCRANFIGTQCDIDAEVLGVAIGGSIAALVIIVITFICLYMWNQRFRHEQQKIEAMSAASGHTFSYMNKPAALAAAATMSRMSTIDERYGGRSSLWATHHGYSDSQQHLLSTTTNSTTNGYGYGNGNGMTNSDHQNASHVYAQPVRVVPNGSSTTNHHHHHNGSTDYDPSGTGGAVYDNSIWGSRTRSSTHKQASKASRQYDYQQHHHDQRRNGTISGSSHGIHYPYKHENYNETEFSTRELIYSPAHLYATSPRHQSSHAYY